MYTLPDVWVTQMQGRKFCGVVTSFILLSIPLSRDPKQSKPARTSVQDWTVHLSCWTSYNKGLFLFSMRVSHYPWRWTVPICSSQRDLALHSSDQPDFVNSKDSSQAKGSVSHIGWYRLWWLALNERWRSVLAELEFLINSNWWIFQLTSQSALTVISFFHAS